MTTTLLVSSFSPFSTLSIPVDLSEDGPADQNLRSLISERNPSLGRLLENGEVYLCQESGRILQEDAPFDFYDSCELESRGGDYDLDHEEDSGLRSPPSFISVRLVPRLLGGKGGFGSQLRAAGGRMSSQKTENKDACRDLSGRRLATVKEAKKLADYISTEEERKKVAAEAQKERLERIEREIAQTTAASATSLEQIGESSSSSKIPEVGTKRRLEDTEYVEQSKEIVDNVKSAVSAGLLKKKKKPKLEPAAKAKTESSTMAEKIVESPATVPVAAAAAVALAAASA